MIRSRRRVPGSPMESKWLSRLIRRQEVTSTKPFCLSNHTDFRRSPLKPLDLDLRQVSMFHPKTRPRLVLRACRREVSGTTAEEVAMAAPAGVMVRAAMGAVAIMAVAPEGP